MTDQPEREPHTYTTTELIDILKRLDPEGSFPVTLRFKDRDGDTDTDYAVYIVSKTLIPERVFISATEGGKIVIRR